MLFYQWLRYVFDYGFPLCDSGFFSSSFIFCALSDVNKPTNKHKNKQHSYLGKVGFLQTCAFHEELICIKN